MNKRKGRMEGRHCPVCKHKPVWISLYEFLLNDKRHKIIICDNCNFKGYLEVNENIFKDLDLNPVIDRDKTTQKETL